MGQSAQARDGERERRGVAGGSFGRARRTYSRLSWAHRLLGWLFGATTVTIIAVTAAKLAWDIALPGARVVSATEIEPEEATSQRLGVRSQLFSIVGYDARGRRAAFDVIVLDKAYTWTRGSARELAEDGRALPAAALIETVLGGPIREQLAQSRGAIAVGVASEEGNLETETRRASERADQTARWLRSVLGREKPLWTLNLGQYRSSGRNFDAGTTSWQRPFIVIGISAADNGIDMSEALADAMRGKSNLPSPDNYSNFELDEIQ
ncbi:MAG: hypothetical protein R3D27_01210 [Hyphomicrobiaceae bacterium]